MPIQATDTTGAVSLSDHSSALPAPSAGTSSADRTASGCSGISGISVKTGPTSHTDNGTYGLMPLDASGFLTPTSADSAALIAELFVSGLSPEVEGSPTDKQAPYSYAADAAGMHDSRESLTGRPDADGDNSLEVVTLNRPMDREGSSHRLRFNLCTAPSGDIPLPGAASEVQTLESNVLMDANLGGAAIATDSHAVYEPGKHPSAEQDTKSRSSTAIKAVCSAAAATPSAASAMHAASVPQRHDPNIDSRKPIFHVMPKSGWGSDPNGPIFYKGRYHL